MTDDKPSLYMHLQIGEVLLNLPSERTCLHILLALQLPGGGDVSLLVN